MDLGSHEENNFNLLEAIKSSKIVLTIVLERDRSR